MLLDDNSKRNLSEGSVQHVQSASAQPTGSLGSNAVPQQSSPTNAGAGTVSQVPPRGSPQNSSTGLQAGMVGAQAKSTVGTGAKAPVPVSTPAPTSQSGSQPVSVAATQISPLPEEAIATEASPPYPIPPASFLGNAPGSDECLDETPEQVELETLKVAKKLHIRKIIFGILSIVGLIACFIICLGCGREDIWPFTAIEVIWNHVTGMGEFSLADKIVIWDIRLPIVCAATLAGAALSVSGASYQGLFRNPLVSPDILGAAAGAAFGAAMALLLNFDNTMVELFAFIGGFVAVMITWISASYIGNGSNQPLLLVLTGLITATLFQACVEIIKYIADPYSTLPEITYWLMGSLAKVTWSNLGFFCIPFIIGMVPVLLLRWRLNALSMGDDEAKSLGINVPLMRGIFIFCATLLTAAVVSIAGIVGWVGLIIPHITRFMFGPDNRIVLPMSTVIGAIFLMIVSTICRSAIASEIPLGVLTSIVGAPLFFIILIKTRLGQAGT